ncbi:MAG: hypothetical protein IJ367_01315, partial [Clostridia bacterium]|nr:hypothetical protein [Clostridia bacterium]
MKNLSIFFLIGVLILGVANVVYAKDIQQVQRTMAERIGERRTRQMMRNLAPETKQITKEEFVNRKLTRGERREIRQEKKKGIYKSPAEEFALMDKNEDGIVSPDEMN